MRKLLLASAAMLSATAGAAFAQAPTAAASQGQYAAPWAAGPSANNNNNSVGIAVPGADARPTPGTVVIRLNGRVEFETVAQWTTSDKTAAYKLNPINMDSYMRLYPGVDGMSVNGIRYGAAIELRENWTAPASQNQTLTGAASGVSIIGPTTGASASGNSSAETVFVRRAFTYVGTDQLGILRLGQADGVIGLFDGGVFTSQTWDGGDGNFNGGPLQALANSTATAIPFVWLSQAGAEYGNTKAVYLSPQFYGFDFGVQYAPNPGNLYSNAGCSASIANSQTCAAVTSGTDPTRYLNQVAVGARYQGTFGGVGLKGMVVYETAGKESLNGRVPAVSPAAVTASTSTATQKYDNLSFVTAAAAVQFAGVTVAADWIGGQLNGQLTNRPTGGAPEEGIVAGITYQNGPIIVGAETALVNSQGQANLIHISQRHEFEVAFGGTYTVAPGLSVVAEYMYTQRHQGDYSFATGAVGATGDAHGNGVMLGTVVTW